jgi:tetratricopeptide (TPR) repeat protein
VHSSTIPRLRQGYKKIAKSLKLPGWDDLNVDTFKLINDWLSDSQNGEWLIVLDNADDINIFYPPQTLQMSDDDKDDESYHHMADYLPRSPCGSMIITTRDKRLGERLADREKPIVVDAMNYTDAERLLRSKVGNSDESEDSSVKELLEILGYLPLALTQASAFINENDITVTEYLTEIKRNDAQVQEILSMDHGDHRRYSESGSSVLSTWKLSFEQISKQQPLAAEILSLMAVMDLYSVPKYLVIEPDANFSQTTSAFGTLKAFSLITAVKAGKEFEMHCLIQISVRHWLEIQNNLSGFQRSALRILSEHFPVGDFENWRKCEQLYPHAQLVLQYPSESNEEFLQRALLLHNMARYNDAEGRYPVAHSRFSEALTLRKKLLGLEDFDTLETASFLGEVLFREQKYKEGEEVMGFVLSGSKKTLGPDHSFTRMNMGHLAEMKTGQGHFTEAEALYRGALKGKEEELGTELVDLKNADNLGAALRRKGEYDEAESWIRRSMIGREKSLGPIHPQTLRAVNHLGLILHRMGRNAEAELLNRRALDGFEQTLGREHHFTLQSLDNLSSVLRSHGKYEEAEKESRRAHAGLERLLGPEHRHTLQSLMSIALALEMQDKLEEAEILAKQALVVEYRTLGPDHPQIRVSAASVERILRKEGKDDEANEIHVRYLKLT